MTSFRDCLFAELPGHDRDRWQLLAPGPHPLFQPSPKRHKGQAGLVLIIGGSKGMIGAPCLAALGALRAGCGIAALAVPGALRVDAQCGRPEFMVHPVGKGASFSAADADSLAACVVKLKPKALVIGPGLGRGKGALAALQAVLALKERPNTVFDADALFFLSQALAGDLRPKDVISPHPGEAARLLPDTFFSKGKSTGNAPDIQTRTTLVQQQRPAALAVLSTIFPATVLLKGAHTLIGRAGERTTLSPFAEASLAVGGSGDVLSGIIAALMATEMDSYEAACFGVHLHGRAGAILSRKALLGHLAGEIADTVPLAWSELCPS